MVKALLREGIWSPEAALGFAANGADAESRAKTAIALLEAGPQWSWAEARQITIRSLISMSRPRESVIADYAAALTQLPAYSPQRSEESIIENLDAIVPPAVEDREAAVTLAAFAPLLSDRALSRAETLASTLRSPLRRAYANATLAARGGRSAIADLDQALAVAFEEAGNLGRSEAIGSFLQAGGDPAWAATQVNETLLLADANEQFRWRIYANVIHLSSPPDLTLRLRHLLGNDGIFSFNSGSKLPDLTRRLAGPIASLLLDPAVLATLEDSLTHFRWLLMAIRVAPSLPETQRPALVDQIIDILQPGDLDGSLSRILANLGPLPPHQLDRALSLAQALQPLRKADALGGLGACAPPPRRAVIAAQALDLIADFNPGTESAETLGRLAPVLDKAGLRRAVRIVETIGDKQASTDHLSTLIPYLRDGYKERAMRRAIELIGTYEARDGSDVGSIYGARFLGAMAPDLPRSLTGDAATAARSLSEPVWRALALAALAPAFAPEDQPAVLAEARHNLPDDATPSSRAEVLAAFAAAQGTEREQFVNAAIAEIEQTKSFRDTADAIQAVRPVLSDVQLAATVQRCIGRTDRSEQAQKIVARFARTLPMSFIEQSLSLFEDILPENRYLLVPLLVRLVGAGQEDRARRLAKQQGLQAETALPILGVEEAIDLLADHPTDSMKVSIATRMAELGNTQAARAVLNQLSEPDAALALSCRLAVLASQRRDHREVLQLWQRCLDRTAALKRVNTFEAINKLAPVAAAIAGRDGPNGLLDAVEQALAWWP